MTVPALVPRWLARRGLLLLALVGEPVMAGDAASQEPSASPEARARFDAGVAAFSEGRYLDAIERFREADALAPSPFFSFNIARVYERMADDRRALGSYREYLRRLPDAHNRDLVERRIAELEQVLSTSGVQQLSVLSTPAGATLRVDDVPHGVTPWTGELSPGPHTLELRLTGYRPAVREIDLPARRAIDVQLALQPGVVVTSSAGLAPPKLSPLLEPPPPLTSPVPVPRWWTWALFGSSAAALIGAGALELERRDLEDDARESQVQLTHQQRFEAMQRSQIAARAFAGVGAAAALAGVVSLYLDLRAADEPPGGVALGCGPSGCGLSGKAHF